MNFDQNPEKNKGENFSEKEPPPNGKESLRKKTIQAMVNLDSYNDDRYEVQNTEEAMELVEALGELITYCKVEIVPNLFLLKDDPLVAAFNSSVEKARIILIRFIKRAQELSLKETEGNGHKKDNGHKK